MKPWNTWVARLGCAGLCLALVGCGGSSVPDPDSDANAAKGTLPGGGAAPAIVQTEPAPAPTAAPAPAPTPAPAPEAAAAPAPAPTPAPTASPTPEPDAAQPKAEAAASKPPEAVAAAETPAAPASPFAASAPPAPSGSPAPAAAAAPADPKAKADSNPFAVLSEGQPTPPAAANPAPGAALAGGAPEVPPQEVPPADAPPAAEGNQGALGFLEAAAANRGNRKLYTNPTTAATTFLAAIKEKDLNKIAQATALRAATESKNQKLFQLILAQELAQEDLDELAKKLSGFTLSGTNVPKSSGSIGVTVTKPEGTSIMRRTITMRHEKAGWKVLDIGGEGELEKPIVMPRMSGRGGMRGGGRRARPV